MKGAAFSRFLAFMGVLAGVVSCGGGTDLAGIGGTGITSDGTITSFGSVFVNGVEYEVDNTTSITVDGVPDKTQNDLKIGMVVTVKGTLNADGTTGIASSIVSRNEVKGPVANLDPVTCRFEVLGLSVTTDSLTVFRDSTNVVTPSTVITCADLASGDRVEVSGFRTDDTTVRATHVERKSIAPDALEVKGRVEALGNSTFKIGLLTVDFSNPQSVDNFAVGDFVEVKGTLNSDGTLQATSIKVVEDGFSANQGDEVELEGIIVGFDSASGLFNISGQPVQIPEQTAVEYGKWADLMPTVRVEVEGVINNNGVLVAKKVIIRREAPYEIKGTVQAVSLSAGTITIMDKTITIDNLTQFEDESSERLFPFSLKDISNGNYVEVDAFLDPVGNKIVATRVEREVPESEVEIEGPVDQDSVDALASMFKILGITVSTTNGTNFKDQADNPMPRTDFFDSLRRNPGSVVSVKGSFDSGRIVAGEVELEE